MSILRSPVRSTLRSPLFSPLVGKFGGALDADAIVRFEAMTGTPDADHKLWYSDFVTSLKDAGVWDKIDVGYLTSDLDAQASGLNIKDPATFALAPQNSPTHTSYRGFSSNGTTSYLKTGFIPSTHAVQLAQNSAHIAALSLTERAASAGALGNASSPTNRNLGITPRYTGDLTYFFLNSAVTGYSHKSSQGMFIGSRTASNFVSWYRDGFLLTANAQVSTGLPAVEAYILAQNGNGTTSGWNTDTIGFWSTGAALSDAEQIALTNALYTWASNIGALTKPNLVVCDGNSFTSGYGLSAWLSYPSVLNGLLAAAGVRNAISNKGVTGQTTAQMSADAVTDIYPLLTRAHTTSVLVAWEIRNDMYVNGVTVAQGVDAIEAYCDAARTAGFDKIVLINVKPDAAFQNTWQTGVWDTVNTEIDGRWAGFADALVDLRLITEIQNPLNATYFQADTVHLTAAGYALVAAAVQTAVEAVVA